MFAFQSVYKWIVKPQTNNKLNEMFLPGRMAFIFNMVRIFVASTFLSNLYLSLLPYACLVYSSLNYLRACWEPNVGSS